MAENSRSKVTITLGDGGQVVKKAGPALDITFGDSESTAQRKRSILDRLGGNVEISMSKRPRGDGREVILNASNCVDDMGLSEDDLRFKIMQKKMHKKTRSDNLETQIDLRDMLSRPAQSSTTSVGERQHMPDRKDSNQRLQDPRDSRGYMSEMKDSRLRTAEVRDVRQYTRVEDPRLHTSGIRESRPHIAEDRSSRQPMVDIVESRQRVPEVTSSRQRAPEDTYSRQRVPEVTSSRQRVPEFTDSRHRLSEAIDSRHRIAEVRDNRHHISEVSSSSGMHMAEIRHNRQQLLDVKGVGRHMPDPYSLSITGRIPSTTVGSSLTHYDTSKSSYSPWSLEGIRRRSPDGVVSSVRGLSPPRRGEEFRRPSVSSYDNSRVSSYMGKDVIEFSRPVSTSYMATPALPASKLMGPPLPPAPPGSLTQRSSYAVDEPLTVDRFLYSLGLEKYAINFKAEEVDMYALKQMGESDLKDLGIPMGPRRKILLALQPYAKRPI